MNVAIRDDDNDVDGGKMGKRQRWAAFCRRCRDGNDDISVIRQDGDNGYVYGLGGWDGGQKQSWMSLHH